jgi:DNA gyrase/topoisomerase IV subunit B
MIKPQILRSQLEESLDDVISGATLLADSLLTREDRRDRILQECNLLRQELFNEYIQYVKKNFHLIIKDLFYSSQNRKVQMKMLMKKFNQYKQKLMIYENRYCFFTLEVMK